MIGKSGTKRYSTIWCLFTVFSLLLFPQGCSSTMPSPLSASAGAPVQQINLPASSRPYRVMGKWYHPLSQAQGFRQTGIASWYGEDFHGKSTSSGETYNMNKISAAHKTLPLGTYVRVRNLKNGKTLDIRINDRGPFVAGRVIDLSKAAAKEIGVYGPGTGRVEVVVLGIPGQLTAQAGGHRSYTPVNYYSGSFTIQVGAFKELGNAKKFWKNLDSHFKHAHITPYHSHANGDRFYRVAVGRCSTLDRAGLYEDILREKGFNGAFVVAE